MPEQWLPAKVRDLLVPDMAEHEARESLIKRIPGEFLTAKKSLNISWVIWFPILLSVWLVHLELQQRFINFF